VEEDNRKGGLKKKLVPAKKHDPEEGVPQRWGKVAKTAAHPNPSSRAKVVGNEPVRFPTGKRRGVVGVKSKGHS